MTAPVKEKERKVLSDPCSSVTPDLTEGKLLGIGNPLLDMTVNGDEALLNKYGLEANDAILVSETQTPLFQELLENYDVQFSAGGSAQNTLRVCQWILRVPKVCVFMGAVGADEYSKILQRTAEASGVKVLYQYHKGVPTGTCAAIITNHEGPKRSLCANLAAAEYFTTDHINKPENVAYIQKAQVYYITGFFLTVNMETVLKIGQVAAASNKIFVTNLSAAFICKSFKGPLMKIIPYADVIFGNETELMTFAREQKLPTKSVGDAALAVVNLPKENKSWRRIVIITRGPEPVLYIKDNTVLEMPVIQLPADKIVDTNGTGDALVGGFLSQLLIGRPFEECLECGIWAAAQVIQHSGCSFDRNVEYKKKESPPVQ